MVTTDLVKMSDTEMMNRVNSARFPQELTQTDKKLLVLAAKTYGFDPIMGEISIFQGKPYVTIDGRRRKAQETGNYCGLKTRPATPPEREAWQIPPVDYFFHAEVTVKGGGFNVFEGWGRVRLAEITPGGKFKPIDVNPQKMAEKRAEADALRKAFHIPLPSYEEAGLDTEEPTPVIEKELETTPAQIDTIKAYKDIDTLFDKTIYPIYVEMPWLRESLTTLRWVSVIQYLKDTYGCTHERVGECLEQMNQEQQHQFKEEIKFRLENLPAK